MNKILRKNIAVFMIALIATMPFYVSSAFAQGNVQNPAQSCIEKNQQGKDFVEFMDSGPIKTLETVASTLHFTCTAWSTVDVAISITQIPLGFVSDPANPDPAAQVTTCAIALKTPGVNSFVLAACEVNEAVRHVRTALGVVFDPLCSLQECAFCNSKPGDLSPAKGVTKAADFAGASPETVKKIQGVQKSLGETKDFFQLSPYDNIYVAMACMCPVGILFNLRKLKTIYQTNNCCIEQACANGVSVESCDRQFSEATCMYWQGSVFSMLIKIIISFIADYIIKNFLPKKIEELIGAGFAYGQAIFALFNAYNHIQKLQSSFKWMSETFSEPECDDLGFGKIRDERRGEATSKFCTLVQIDLNNDGRFDRIVPRCP
ncbi:hypothetical protein HYU09_00900 [Candidatus Woesearchaeota archaeon]|nr:hypothetical protein [Candidatus Woesearchaeota archaeon]